MDQVELSPPVKVCQFCKKEFNSGKALGGHIRIHYQDMRLNNLNHFKMEKGSSSASSESHDGVGFLPESWGFRQKRKSRPILKKDKIETQINTKRQELKAVDSTANETVNEDETDHYEEGVMLESLKELSSYSKHQITRTGKTYVCMLCDIDFPTSDDARVHISEAIGADTATEARATFAESDESGSVNQAANEARGNCKPLEFDLNELPPIEDDDAGSLFRSN